MDLLNFSNIKRGVSEKCEKEALILKYENSNKPFPKTVDKEYGYNGELLPSIGSIGRFQKKGRFIYHVIYSGIFHNIEGTKLGITDVEIQEKYNKLTRLVEVYESFNVEEEFIHHIVSSARQIIKDDKADIEALENGPLLNKLINRTETFATMKIEVVRLSKMVKKVDADMYALLKKIHKREITGSEFDKKMDELEEVYHSFRSQYENLMTRYKLDSERGLQRRRTRLRQCVKPEDLYGVKPTSSPELNYVTITRCSFLIEEYCRWYNDRLRVDRIEDKQEGKNAKKRKKRLENKATTPQFQLKQSRIELIQPLLEEGMNPNQIAVATGLPKSTVQRIVIELKEE